MQSHFADCFSVNPAGSATSTSWPTSGCTRRLRSRRQLSFGASAASSTQSGCTCFPRPRCSVSSRETTLRSIWTTSSTWLKAVMISDTYVFFEMLILVVFLSLAQETHRLLWRFSQQPSCHHLAVGHPVKWLHRRREGYVPEGNLFILWRVIFVCWYKIITVNMFCTASYFCIIIIMILCYYNHSILTSKSLTLLKVDFISPYLSSPSSKLVKEWEHLSSYQFWTSA